MKTRDGERESDYFAVDKNRLDEEWVRHIPLYHSHADQLADAREALERAKAAEEVSDDDRKYIAAQLDLAVRKDPMAYGLECADGKKPTEGAIGNAVTVSKRYRKAQQACYDARDVVIKAKHKTDLLESAVKTLDHRKKAIEDLVTLRLKDYFSEPRLPKNDAGEYMRDAKRDAAFGKRKDR